MLESISWIIYCMNQLCFDPKRQSRLCRIFGDLMQLGRYVTHSNQGNLPALSRYPQSFLHRYIILLSVMDLHEICKMPLVDHPDKNPGNPSKRPPYLIESLFILFKLFFPAKFKRFSSLLDAHHEPISTNQKRSTIGYTDLERCGNIPTSHGIRSCFCFRRQSP